MSDGWDCNWASNRFSRTIFCYVFWHWVFVEYVAARNVDDGARVPDHRCAHCRRSELVWIHNEADVCMAGACWTVWCATAWRCGHFNRWLFRRGRIGYNDAYATSSRISNVLGGAIICAVFFLFIIEICYFKGCTDFSYNFEYNSVWRKEV